MENNPTLHRFTLICKEASERNYCWKLNCTTCGCVEFMELLQRKAPVVIPLLERYAQNNLHSGQEKLLLQLGNISFQELVEQVPNFENMLGYIGVVLSATEDAEKKTRILTNALVPGIIEYLEKKGRNKKFYEKIVQGNESVLSRQDLSQLEIISH